MKFLLLDLFLPQISDCVNLQKPVSMFLLERIAAYEFQYFSFAHLIQCQRLEIYEITRLQWQHHLHNHLSRFKVPLTDIVTIQIISNR